MLKKFKRIEEGFTLVELVVVIAILAVLVTLIVPKIMGNVKEAEKNTEIGNARTLASEISVYNAQITSVSIDVPVKSTDGNIYISEPEYVAAGRSLPAGSKWPTGTWAKITIDADGNAGVEIQP